ncbi:MAG TPA: acyltransferase [Acidocella sp.]|nr:acyltransferase [Acidocella sp.]
MERLTRLDGLRGVLAVYVMLGHALPYTMLPTWAGAPFVHGEAAVDVFFALSGLVVINSLERFNYRAGPFLAGRARRLLPVYFTVLALAVGLIWLGSPLPEMPWIAPASLQADFWAIGMPPQFIWHLLAHITLVQGLLPQGLLPWAYITLLGPAWSLSTEWQFYIIMALLMRRVRSLTRFGILLLAVAVVYRVMEGFLPVYWQFSRAFLPDAAGFFGLGVMSAVWLRKGHGLPLAAAVLVVAALGLFSGAPVRLLTPLVWLLVLLVQKYGVMPPLARALDSRVVQYLGAISYPLYLLNAPVQRACAMLVAPLVHGSAAMFGWLWLPLALAAPVLAAAILHHAVEVRFMRAPRRLTPISIPGSPPCRSLGR